MKKNMEHWWNDTDKKKQKYLEKNLSQGYFVYHKYRKEWPGLVSGLPRLQNFGSHYAVTDKIPLNRPTS